MQPERPRSHLDLMPRDLCPSLAMKHLLTHGLADRITNDRQFPGDGYYWCSRTCTPVGPDDELAHPLHCRPGRGCFAGPSA